MKMSRLLLAVLAALAVWGWIALHPSPERQIRRQLQSLARAASFEPGEGSLTQLAGASRAAEFFSADVEVIIDAPGLSNRRIEGRDEVQQALAIAHGGGRGLRVAFPDVAVAVATDSQSAVADVTLEARVIGQPDADRIVQEMRFTFRKTDGQWRIVKVATVKTLS